MYTFSIETSLTVDETIAKLGEALASEKLGIVSDINVAGILKAKLDKDIPAYRILGACQPGLALRAITADPEAGALLPCQIVVQDAGGKTRVSFMDPAPVLGLANNTEVAAVAADAKPMLQRVAEKLAG